MTTFSGVTVNQAANIYFDGNVTSRTVLFADGSKKTLGIMLPGQYEFGTEQAELMEIVAGEMSVKLPGNADWQVITAGQSFSVPANASFQLDVKQVVDYTCSYL
jgi:uncharacterized protein YaiE (UPF0345 family)